MPLAKPLKSASYGASLAQYAQFSSVFGDVTARARLPLNPTDSTATLAALTSTSDNLKPTRSGMAFVTDCGAVMATIAEPTATDGDASPVIRNDPAMPSGAPRFNSITKVSSDPSRIVTPLACKPTRPFISPGRFASLSSRRCKLGLVRKLIVSRRLAKPARRVLSGLSFSESPLASYGMARGSRAASGERALATLKSISTETPMMSPIKCFALSVPVSVRSNSPCGQLTCIGGRLVPASASWASK